MSDSKNTPSVTPQTTITQDATGKSDRVKAKTRKTSDARARKPTSIRRVSPMKLQPDYHPGSSRPPKVGKLPERVRGMTIQQKINTEKLTTLFVIEEAPWEPIFKLSKML